MSSFDLCLVDHSILSLVAECSTSITRPNSLVQLNWVPLVRMRWSGLYRPQQTNRQQLMGTGRCQGRQWRQGVLGNTIILLISLHALDQAVWHSTKHTPKQLQVQGFPFWPVWNAIKYPQEMSTSFFRGLTGITQYVCIYNKISKFTWARHSQLEHTVIFSCNSNFITGSPLLTKTQKPIVGIKKYLLALGIFIRFTLQIKYIIYRTIIITILTFSKLQSPQMSKHQWKGICRMRTTKC
jgi:hypothetical protein